MKVLIMEDEVKHVTCLYCICGLSILYLFVDIQFKAIKDCGQLSATISVVAKGEYVPENARFD